MKLIIFFYKIQEFGPDDTPLSETEFTLPLLSRMNKTTSLRSMVRIKRNIENRIIIKAKLDEKDLENIISTLNFSGIYSQTFYV